MYVSIFLDQAQNAQTLKVWTHFLSPVNHHAHSWYSLSQDDPQPLPWITQRRGQWGWCGLRKLSPLEGQSHFIPLPAPHLSAFETTCGFCTCCWRVRKMQWSGLSFLQLCCGAVVLNDLVFCCYPQSCPVALLDSKSPHSTVSKRQHLTWHWISSLWRSILLTVEKRSGWSWDWHVTNAHLKPLSIYLSVIL